MSDTYDFETGLWSAKNKSETYYRFDYRGQSAPIKQIETNAVIHINANDVITCIEFENVPYEYRIPQYESDEAEVHQRTSGALLERERIIKLLEPLGCEANGVEHDCQNGLGYTTAADLIALIKGEK